MSFTLARFVIRAWIVAAVFAVSFVQLAVPVEARERQDYCQTPLTERQIEKRLKELQVYVAGVSVLTFIPARRMMSMITPNDGSAEAQRGLNASAWVATFLITRRTLAKEFRQIRCLRRRLDYLRGSRGGRRGPILQVSQRQKIGVLIGRIDRILVDWVRLIVLARKIAWIGNPKTGPFVVYSGPGARNAARRVYLRRVAEAPTIAVRKVVTPIIIWDERTVQIAGLIRKKKPGRKFDRGSRGTGGKFHPLAEGPSTPLKDVRAGDFGGEIRLDGDRTFGPDITFGRNPFGGALHRFKNNSWGIQPSYNFWWQLPRIRLHAEIFGGVWGGKESKGPTNGNGFVSLINGTNSAAVTATRNTNLKWSGHRLGGRTYGVWQDRLRAGRILLGLIAGAVISHAYRNYDYSTEVSGGGAFFTNNVNLKMYTLFVAPLVGGYMTYRIAKDWYMTVGGAIAPGYQRYRLDAVQTGTALPPGASVRSNANGFAFRANFGLRLHRDLTRNLRLSFMARGEFDSAAPTLDEASTGNPLRAARAAAWRFRFGTKLTIRY